MAKQMELDLDVKETKHHGPVNCLGKEFSNDEARRVHFIELLREKLKDPEFRQIEGFPIGKDEDILALSDPPYYTACPNPWIGEFLNEWESDKPEKPKGYHYHREPFAADVSEGKNDPIYNAHSYHTKVPHRAIMRYILHYTDPGDTVLDGFCGTGMTGVAAQMCGDRATVESLGYEVKKDGTILQQVINESGKPVWKPFSRLGARKAVLNDLSPAAVFIAYNYNTPVDAMAFEKKAKRILKEVEDESGWMYETLHSDGQTKLRVDYVVWSEIFSCPECTGEVVFLEEAMDKETQKVMKEFPCPHCNVVITKKKMSHIFESYYDQLLKETKERSKKKPVQIAYRLGKLKYTKVPDKVDLKILEQISELDLPGTVPISEYRYDDMWEAPRMLSRGITHVHHLFLPRQLQSLSLLWKKVKEVRSEREKKMLFFWLDQSIAGLSVLNRYAPTHYSQVNRQMSGVYYISSQLSECSPWYNLSGKLTRLSKAFKNPNFMNERCLLGTCSSANLNIQSESLDYIFVDPPFGDNFAYAELNFLVESWFGVTTDMRPEAIVDRSKKNRSAQKSLNEYRQLMNACFKEAYRVLKPGRWMTVEFSNTKAAVWNSIQTALTETGFIVANVSALDKKQRSFKAVTTPTAVKQDLIISAYKPNGGFRERFESEATSEEGVWDFVRTHLKYLPVIKEIGAYYHMKKAAAGEEAVAKMTPMLQTIPERDPRILYDQVVSYYVRNKLIVPLSSPEFQQGLQTHFIERDGMYFLPEQAAVYDKKRLLCDRAEETFSLFVEDEDSAIQWLRKNIDKKPQTFSDLNSPFMQQLGGWKKNELQLDLRELLHDNFLSYDGNGRVPEQIHSYLSSAYKDLRNLEKNDPKLMAKAKDRWYVPDPNKVGDLEKIRERSLLKEFETYKQTKKKLKIFRLEAVRAGFKKAWQEKKFQTIITVADKIPKKILEEDQKLLMWYDQAVTRMDE